MRDTLGLKIAPQDGGALDHVAQRAEAVDDGLKGGLDRLGQLLRSVLVTELTRVGGEGREEQGIAFSRFDDPGAFGVVQFRIGRQGLRSGVLRKWGQMDRRHWRVFQQRVDLLGRAAGDNDARRGAFGLHEGLKHGDRTFVEPMQVIEGQGGCAGLRKPGQSVGGQRNSTRLQLFGGQKNGLGGLQAKQPGHHHDVLIFERDPN